MRAAGVHLHTQGPGTGENAFKKAQLLKVCCDMDRHDGTRHQTNAPLFTQQNYKSATCARCVCDATRATSSDGDDQSAQQSRIKRAPSKDDRWCCCCCCQTDRACAQSARSRTAHFLLCVLPGQQQHLGNTRTHTHTHWHPFQAATAPPPRAVWPSDAQRMDALLQSASPTLRTRSARNLFASDVQTIRCLYSMLWCMRVCVRAVFVCTS